MTTLTLWWKSNADVAEEQQQQATEYTPEQVNEIEQEQADEDEEELLEMWA
jgi:hypothetical protein|tara:strand:+ start:721 stop:873 length:153 start_codon:yes stop_codon:yes gene_type:complete